MSAPSEASWDYHCGDLAMAAAGDDVVEMPRSWREAAALYRRLGVRTLAEAVTAVLGPAIPVRQARRGDIVMVRGSLGICRGEVAECIGATVRIGEAEKAWRVTGRRCLLHRGSS